MMRASLLIREARRRAGLTQKQLAERLETSQSVIARWESGRARPSLENLERVVRACGLELRLGIGEADTAERSLIERNLALSPGERLDQLVRTVRFIRAGRAALAARDG
jgi:transcriptional regulator with XRE-family HTH domain